jgi:hypothetical protein
MVYINCDYSKVGKKFDYCIAIPYYRFLHVQNWYLDWGCYTVPFKFVTLVYQYDPLTYHSLQQTPKILSSFHREVRPHDSYCSRIQWEWGNCSWLLSIESNFRLFHCCNYFVIHFEASLVVTRWQPWYAMSSHDLVHRAGALSFYTTFAMNCWVAVSTPHWMLSQYFTSLETPLSWRDLARIPCLCDRC